jgi:hypothetical protein
LQRQLVTTKAHPHFAEQLFKRETLPVDGVPFTSNIATLRDILLLHPQPLTIERFTQLPIYQDLTE